ncbi:hypothetical protein DAPPUDRAFT_325540 [Daphnia pulex]|uniref:Homeobox domain-containing protein n=1 Tax=Daphnia pulex TaxID=6669 RepID=E9H523_DAPPU|nr:hypothetical protein DAPPUDRAFT_325540 [Daphnia pulex]|eukprot:EFX73248.1 hypothetical protein DAPPUDRAFT_325540 [Daphnia pulex]
MASYDYCLVDYTAKSSRSGWQRHFYDEVQLELLDAEFARDSFPNREGRRRITQLIGVSEKSIMVWLFILVISESSPTCPSTWNFTSRQPRLQLTKQIANIVDHRITLVNANKILTFRLTSLLLDSILVLKFFTPVANQQLNVRAINIVSTSI